METLKSEVDSMRKQVQRLLAAALLSVMPAGCGAFGGSGPFCAAPLPPLSDKMKGMTEAGYSPDVFGQQAVTGELSRLRRDGVTWLAIQVAWFQDQVAAKTLRRQA